MPRSHSTERSRPGARAKSRRRFLRQASVAPFLLSPLFTRAKGHVRVGAVLPLTGDLSRFGAQARLGLELAVNQVNNSGGILGQSIAMTFHDDAANPSKAEAAARALTSDPGIVAVAGPITSASRNALSPTMMASGTPLLYATDYEGGDCGDSLFYFNSVPNQSATPLMQFLVDAPGMRVYLLGADYIWPHSMFKACTDVIAAKGGVVAGRRFVPLAGLSDYTPVISAIQKSGATVLVLALPGTAHINFINAAHKSGLFKGMTIGNLGAVSLYGGPPDDSVPVYGCAPFVESDPLPTVQAFVALARARAGKDAAVSAYVATHFNAVIALKHACERAGDTTRQAVNAGLRGLEYSTPTGPSMIDRDTHHSTLRMAVARATGNGPQIVSGLTPTSIAPAAACVTGTTASSSR